MTSPAPQSPRLRALRRALVILLPAGARRAGWADSAV